MNPAIANRLSSASKILYMSHMAIGDYLYQRTYLHMLSEQYPNAEIDLWIDDFRTKGKDWQKGRSDFLSNWMKDETFITRLYPQAASIGHRKEMLEEAKNRGYDAVLFIANLRSERFASAAKEIAGKSGYCAGVVNQKSLDWLQPWKFAGLDACYRNNKRDGQKPILAKYGDNFAQLAGLHNAPAIASLTVEADAKTLAGDVLQRWHNKFGTQRMMLVNTISTTAKRDYPWDKMEAVIQRLHGQYPDYLFVLNVPPHLIEDFTGKAEAIVSHHQIPAVAFTAKAGVQSLAAMINQADCVLTVETAIMHFAEALSVSQCVLMRNASAHWCPPSANCRLFSGTIVADLSVDAVTDNALSLLDEVGASSGLSRYKSSSI